MNSRRKFKQLLLVLGVLLLPGVSALVLVGTSTASAVLQAMQKREQSLDNDQEDREKYQQEFQRKHTDPSGRVRPDLWQQGIEHFKRMKAAPQAVPGDGIGTRWTQIGPAGLKIDAGNQNVMGSGPNSGEVVDIAIDPRGSTDQVIYIATNDGGIWKSTNGGASWNPKTDFQTSLSMGAVALDPSNPSIVYAGTGDIFEGSGRYGASVNIKAVGLYKSLDAGETWSAPLNPLINPPNPRGIFTGVGINRIVVPASNVVLVATGNGLFCSVDGGQNFGIAPFFNNNQPVLGANGVFISDLKLDTASASTVYAAVSGQGIFKSTDGGRTFPSINNLFMSGNSPKPNTPTNYQRIAISQSTMVGGAVNNQTIYASVENNDSKFNGLYKTTDLGGTWSQIQPYNVFSCGSNNCAYDLTVGVDPQDAMRVYLGFVNMSRSTDGGANFTPIGGNDIHDDHHALVFSPSSHWAGPAPTMLYVGTDGGIAKSQNGNDGNWMNINDGIATILFLNMDIGRGSAANNGFTYGAAQDMGVSEHNPLIHTGTEWHLNTGGDGFAVAVDPFDAKKAYGRYNSTTVMTTNGGTNWAPIQALTGPPNGTFELIVDPNNGATLLTSGGTPSNPNNNNQLWRSTDSGANFTRIRAFPANVVPYAIATVKSDSNTLWVGLADGTVQSTSNALAPTPTWTAHTVTGAPITSLGPVSVGALTIDPTNTSQVVVVYPGFSNINPTNRTKHAFMTTNGGSTWNDISGTDGGNQLTNLPDLPLSSVVIYPGTSPHTIIVASDAGVLRTADLGATWQVLGTGLPIVVCTTLALDSTAGSMLLRIGTYGRSAFELTINAIYVDLANTTGNEDGSPAHPYRTVAGGYAAAVAGDTIIIRAGNYPEIISFNKAVTVRSEGGTVNIGKP
ncbi:MAG: hypothetical protein HYR56_21845 [Acidobacteria bacterium]|nr:hypothetical protein [Acidobacteriota bacterium]MBI3425838.1 hypothetical protein [Acidobacteriota bacterium]